MVVFICKQRSPQTGAARERVFRADTLCGGGGGAGVAAAVRGEASRVHVCVSYIRAENRFWAAEIARQRHAGANEEEEERELFSSVCCSRRNNIVFLPGAGGRLVQDYYF